MKRRTLLRTTGTAPLAVAAGCTSSSDPENAGGNGTGEDPPRGDVGLTIETGGLELTLEDVEIAIELEGAGGDVSESPDGEMWILANVVAKNTSDETQDLPAAENFKLVAENGQYDTVLAAALAKPVSGEVYDAPSDARSGVSAGGWMAFSVPDTTEEATLSWVGSGDYADGEGEASWELAVDPAELPDVGFLELNLPPTVEAGEEFTAEVVLENAGGTDYTVESTLRADYPGGPTDTEPVTLLVPAEDTASVSFSFSSLAIGAFSVALEAYDISKSVDVTPMTASFGKSVAVDGLPEITVSDATISDSFRSEPYYGEPKTVDAEGSFAFFEVAAHRPGDDSPQPPEADDLELSVDGSRYEAGSLHSSNSLRYLDPVEGEEYNPYLGIGAGETTTGIVRFDVPRSTTRGDLELRAEWSLGYGEGETAILWSR